MRNAFGFKKGNDLKGFKLVDGRLEKYDASGNRIVADLVLQLQPGAVYFVRYGFDNPVEDKLETLGVSASGVWSAFYRLDQSNVSTFVALVADGVGPETLAGCPIPQDWDDAAALAGLLCRISGGDEILTTLVDFIRENGDSAPCVWCRPSDCSRCWFYRYEDLIETKPAGDQHLIDVLNGDALVERIPFNIPNPL